jgi:peptidoglycan L-alanyl-D-glutamate endopeptidase CwlK
MGYKLGKRSVTNLEGVDEGLVTVVKYAIGVTKQDFSVICGLRTMDEQKALVAKGASQTMKSKHIDGNAVDLMAYVNGGRWELNLYDEIADAMKEGAEAAGVKLRWGAAWTIDDIGAWKRTTHTYYSKTTQAERNVEYSGSAEDAMNYYIDLRRDQGRRPFIDAPHFELIV